jgi:hypothetical protein
MTVKIERGCNLSMKIVKFETNLDEMKPFLFKILSLICVIFWLQSCSVSSYKYLKNYSTGIEPYPLNLRMGTELFNLREDIYRETTSVESTSITAVNGTERADVSYHPMGFHVCKGVFLDMNENLAVSIVELFDIDETENYQIEEETFSFLSNQRYSIKKEGNEMSRIHERLIGNCIDKITIEDDKISIDECGLLSSKQTISTTPDKMTFEYNLINLFTPTITKEKDNGYKIKNGFGSNQIEQIDNNRIVFKKYLEINRLADRIEFNYHFNSHPFYLIRLDDGLLFENSTNRLVKIKISKNKIDVYEDDRLRKTYTLTTVSK